VHDEPLPDDVLLEGVYPSTLAAHLDRDRPYDGQPHTVYGARGATEVEGLTFRDVQDCFVRACYDASGLAPRDFPGSLRDLPQAQIDLIEVGRHLGLNIERYMGIYPNVPEPERDHTVAHWCGWPMAKAVWLDGPCAAGLDAPAQPCAILDCTEPRVWDCLCVDHLRQLDALQEERGTA
jgi:hypothetical protein